MVEVVNCFPVFFDMTNLSVSFFAATLSFPIAINLPSFTNTSSAVMGLLGTAVIEIEN